MDPGLSTRSPNMDGGKACSMDYFYRRGADAMVRLQNGDCIKFNKGALISRAMSTVLNEVFFGELSDPDITDIPDFDYATFKLFLDCVMGYEPLTFNNAFKIFGVIWKYQIQESINDCIKVLKPIKMTENLSELLNMAVYCECKELIDQTYNFISDNSTYKFLEDENFNSHLEPHSMKFILSKVLIDSHVLEIVKNWAICYVKNNCHSQSVRKFLDNHKLIQFFNLNYCETTDSILKLNHLETEKNLWYSRQILNHIGESNDLIHCKSQWKIMKRDNILVEEIILPAMKNYDVANYSARMKLERNKIVFYENIESVKGSPKSPAKNNPNGRGIITCHVKVTGQDSAKQTIFQFRKEFCFLKNDFDYTFLCTSRGSKFSGDGLERCVIEITWTCLYDCRILLMNRPKDKLNGAENLYFTKSLEASL